MRRLILEDPFSRAAIWSRNFAVFALLVAIIGIALARVGLDATAALAIEGSALALAGLSILSAIVAMGVIWHTGYRGIGLALAGLALSGVLMLYPAYLAVQARTVPVAPDISTDLDDPPAFLSTERARAARHGVVPGPMRADDKDLEARLYPDLDTLTIDDDPGTVFEMIRKLVSHHHWLIADAVEPTDKEGGQIDAVAKTLVMGFPADVTIRIRPSGDQTEVDIRSVSRTGWQEPGSNAARVQALIADIDAAANRS